MAVSSYTHWLARLCKSFFAMATGQVIDTELAWSETDIYGKSQSLPFSVVNSSLNLPYKLFHQNWHLLAQKSFQAGILDTEGLFQDHNYR